MIELKKRERNLINLVEPWNHKEEILAMEIYRSRSS